MMRFEKTDDITEVLLSIRLGTSGNGCKILLQQQHALCDGSNESLHDSDNENLFHNILRLDHVN